MRGGVKPFRGAGADARRYVESDRSTADDYYLGGGDALASWTLSEAHGGVEAAAELEPEAYAAWVDWTHLLTGERTGTPRLPGPDRAGSPRFQEMIVNAPKSLSIAAALHPDVSVALDAAQADAADEIRRYLASHATTRVGPRGAQEVVLVERLHTVRIVHRTSRAGDPHRHVHFQIGTRVWAAGAWRMQADAARAELDCLEAMSLPDAARVIEQNGTERAEARARREATDGARRTPGQWAIPLASRPGSTSPDAGYDQTDNDPA